MVAALLADLRYAFRRLRRAPAFAAIVMLTLALGIGASTAVFTLVDGILIRALPYPAPEQLVRIGTGLESSAGQIAGISDALLLLYQRDSRSFRGVAAWRFDDGDLGPTEQGQTATRVHGARVTANFFEVLGVRPTVGRGFAAGEDRPGRNGVVVVSYRTWREQLHGDPKAVGRRLVINDVPRTIVGIMPERFSYPTEETALWLPLSLDPASTHPSTFNLFGIGRLGPGASAGAARADLAGVLARAVSVNESRDASAQGWTPGQISPRLEPLRDAVIGPAGRLLWLVFASALLVLLVTCANVAALCLARAEQTGGEIAVRRALGASSARLLGATVAEATLLAVAAGACGLLLVVASMRFVHLSATALSLPRLGDVVVSGRTVLFAACATCICAVIASVAPSLWARSLSPARALRAATPGAGGDRRQGRSRGAFVSAQLALALMLVASAGVMTRSFIKLSRVSLGFDPTSVVTSRVLLPYARYSGTATRLGFFRSLETQTGALPGVSRAGLTDWVPLSGDHHDMALRIEDRPSTSGGADHAVAIVDDGFFAALRLPLLRGRLFGASNASATSTDVIVSRAFADLYWPGASPLGKRIAALNGEWLTIVGEVGDAHYTSVADPAEAMVYFPVDASEPAALSVVARAGQGTGGQVVSSIRRIVQHLDAGVPVYDEHLLGELVTAALGQTRTLVWLLAAAGVLASLLAAVGLYGIIIYVVGRRRREIGIRIALGAEPGAVRRMVSLDGVRPAVVGLAVGILGTLASSRLLRGLVYGVAANDFVALLVAPALLLGVALLASWLPARRAAAIDPADALRAD